MPTSVDNTKHGAESGPVKRGPRYSLIILLLIIWGILFLLTASTALTQLSPLAFLAAGALLYFGLVLRNVYRSLNPVRTPILQNPLTQLGVEYEDVIFPSRDGWMLSGWFIPPQNGATVPHTWDGRQPPGFDASRIFTD